MPVWGKLARNTPKVSPGSINNANQSARIRNLDLRYDKGVRTITFYGEVSSSHKPSSYSVMISFKGVLENDGLSDEEILQGYQPKPSLSRHEVLIRCSCPSYRFRFDKANRMNRAGTGARFPAYHRLTARKPNNPHNLPGFCKHALEFIEYLQRQGFIYG